MNMRTKTIGVVLAATLTPAVCHAGAWTLKQGEFYQKLSYYYYNTDENFGSHGGEEWTKDEYRFSSHEVTWYGEFGATDRITLIATVPHKNMHWEKNRRQDDKTLLYSDHDTLGDLEFGARYGFLTGATALSAQFLVKSEVLYDTDEEIMPGYNQTDYELRLLAGRSLWPYGYVNLEAGYRWRTGDPADEIRYLAEYGIDWWRLYAQAKLSGILSAGNGDIPEAFDLTGTYKFNPSLGVEYDLGTMELILGTKLGMGFSVEGFYRGDLYGENIAKGETWGISLVHFWGKK